MRRLPALVAPALSLLLAASALLPTGWTFCVSARDGLSVEPSSKHHAPKCLHVCSAAESQVTGLEDAEDCRDFTPALLPGLTARAGHHDDMAPAATAALVPAWRFVPGGTPVAALPSSGGPPPGPSSLHRQGILLRI